MEWQRRRGDANHLSRVLASMILDLVLCVGFVNERAYFSSSMDFSMIRAWVVGRRLVECSS